MLTYIARRSVSFSPKLSHRLIKFRYGASKLEQSQPTMAAKQDQGIPQQKQVQMWDFELPARFKRKSIDEQEIAIINNGGPL